MLWGLIQLGLDALAAGFSLVAAMGFVAIIGWLFVSVAFIRNAVNTPTKTSPSRPVRIVSRNLKPSIKT